MKNWILMTAAVVSLLTAGCTNLYRTTVTLTQTVDSATKEYVKLFNQGLISPTVDAEVTIAHGKYQQTASVAAGALRAYKLSGDVTQYNVAFAEALKAANGFVGLIVPYLTSTKATQLKTSLSKASTL